jgi:hypothetical protein
MADDLPISTQPGPGMTPSGSTTGSGIGGAVAAVVIFILGRYNITFPAGMEAAIAVLVSTLIGYIPASGRK